jgi:hypothetical protein
MEDIGYSGPFPECCSRVEGVDANDDSFIGSSRGLPGHTDCEYRLADFSNSEFPNTETGEGKGE